MHSENQQSSNSYFHYVLESGAKPFLYRSRVRSLLGVPEWEGNNAAYPPLLPPVGFRYANYDYHHPFTPSLSGLPGSQESTTGEIKTTGIQSTASLEKSANLSSLPSLYDKNGQNSTNGPRGTYGPEKIQEPGTVEQRSTGTRLKGEMESFLYTDVKGKPGPQPSNIVNEEEKVTQNHVLRKPQEPEKTKTVTDNVTQTRFSSLPDAEESRDSKVKETKVSEIQLPGRVEKSKKPPLFTPGNDGKEYRQPGPGNQSILQSPMLKGKEGDESQPPKTVNENKKVTRDQLLEKPEEPGPSKTVTDNVTQTRFSSLADAGESRDSNEKETKVTEILLPGRVEKSMKPPLFTPENDGKEYREPGPGNQSILQSPMLKGKEGEESQPAKMVKEKKKITQIQELGKPQEPEKPKTVTNKVTQTLAVGKSRDQIHHANPSQQEAGLRIEQLRQEVHRLNAKLSSPSSGTNKEAKQEEQTQQVNEQAPQPQPDITVNRWSPQPQNFQTPCAFWERSYLGQFPLKNLV